MFITFIHKKYSVFGFGRKNNILSWKPVNCLFADKPL